MRVIPDNAARSLENAISLGHEWEGIWNEAMKRATDTRDPVQQALLLKMWHTYSLLDRNIRAARRNQCED